jgi:type IV pilus assembly protein PilX
MQSLNRTDRARAQRVLPRLARQQRGVILIVSLVVLVAMMLAAAGLVRSVDTSVVIAGNLAFQQSTLNAADAGVENAVTQLNAAIAAAPAANSFGGTYWYYATMRAVDANGQLASDPFGAATPTAINWNIVPVAQTVNADYEVKVVIDRLCVAGGNCITDPPKPCVQQGCTPATQPPGAQHYRATVRVTGPRNTVSVTQSTLTL